MATTTRFLHYQHPSIVDGFIHFEDEHYEVRGGTVECPLEIGQGADWPRSTDEQVAAFQALADGSRVHGSGG